MMSRKGLDSLPVEDDYSDFAVTVVEYRALSARPTEQTEPSFTDVKAGAFCAEPLAWAVEKNITNGTGNGQFSPNATCTQRQILTFLWRARGEPKPTGTVSGTEFCTRAAQWAKEQSFGHPPPKSPLAIFGKIRYNFTAIKR